MTSHAPTREWDEGDLRWFWTAAEGELGFVGGGDFERAAQAQTAMRPRCPECQRAAAPELVDGVRFAALARFEAPGRRARRAKCRACLGLGVVVPTTYPRGAAPAAATERCPLLAIVAGRDADPLISARLPGWASPFGATRKARERHRAVYLTLRQLEAGHVRVLHVAYGPAPRAFPPEMPQAALILAAMNRALPEQVRVPLLKRIRAGARGNTDPFERSPARSHVNMLLAGSWRAYDRARGRIVDEDRAPFVEAMAEADTRLLRLVEADPISQRVAT